MSGLSEREANCLTHYVIMQECVAKYILYECLTEDTGEKNTAVSYDYATNFNVSNTHIAHIL